MDNSELLSEQLTDGNIDLIVLNDTTHDYVEFWTNKYGLETKIILTSKNFRYSFYLELGWYTWQNNKMDKNNIKLHNNSHVKFCYFKWRASPFIVVFFIRPLSKNKNKN